jgi:glycosyltransferase involved in cell wall biosynthesis
MKPKILVNMPNPHTDNGGVSSHFYGLSRYFSKKQVAYCYTGGLKNYNKIAATPLYLFQYLKFTIKLLIFRPEIINLNPSLRHDAVIRDGIYLLISRLLKKKVIVFWHGWKHDFEETLEEKYLKYFKKVYGKSSAFVILSSEVQTKLRQWGFTQPIYSTTTKVDDFLLKDFDISAKIPTHNILFLGRLERTKGIFETLETFQKLQKSFPLAKLTIAGNGPDERTLQEKALREQIPNVQFLGFIKNEQKIKAFLDADIFILPSYTEGMPTAVLEAMAFGLPVLTTPVGGIPDFFIEGQMGFLAGHEEVCKFADKIKYLYSDKYAWKKISLFNHNYAVKNFLASSIAERMLDFYEKVYSNKAVKSKP